MLTTNLFGDSQHIYRQLGTGQNGDMGVSLPDIYARIYLLEGRMWLFGRRMGVFYGYCGKWVADHG